MAAEPSLLHRLLNWNKKAAPETVDAEQYAEAFGQFKKLLLEQYQLRLRAKTAKRLPINLSAKSTDFGMNPERVKAFFKDQTIDSEDIASEIDKILRTHDRLLLIGDPGAGKTTILLFAAINILLFRDEQKLPLILNLATWQKDRDFKEWYAQSIAHTYSLSSAFVGELLRRNAVVPFFDGFDEVAEEYRDDCFQKMAAYFGDQRNRQLIVSSRKKEYAAAEADAPVYAELEVLPLSLPQIKKALSENALSQASDQALLAALHRDEYLAKAVETPFYLNTASFLFGKGQRTLADFPFKADSTEGRQEELVEIFVAEQVPNLKDRKHLHFLAEKMEEENFLVFELVKMQPGWGKSLWGYRLAVGLAVGLALGLTVGLFVGLGLGLAAGLFAGLAFGLEKRINTSEIEVWSWHKFNKSWRGGLVFGLHIGLFAGLSLGLVHSLVRGLVRGLVFGLAFGLVYGLGWGLKRAGTITSFLLYVPKPYQRFWATFRNNLWPIPILMLAVLLARISVEIWEGTFSLGTWMHTAQDMGLWKRWLPLGLPLFLLPLLLSKFLEHFSLRLGLYLEGKLPLHVVTFMDRMSEQHIFEDNRRTIKGKKQRGATWRFRHKILQDYFARGNAQEI
ncbi:MAG: NACHT domain-containing protein [Saprospiraceae bacterium]